MQVFRSVTVTKGVVIAASWLTIFTEVLVFALQSVVVLDALSLAVDSILERSMSLDFRQLLLMIDVAPTK